MATYDSYTDAQRAVDALSDQRFPVERLAIVGSGLRFVEQVTGRLDLVRAALEGAGQGTFVGALFGLLLGVFVVEEDASPLGLLFYGVLVGALLGAIFAGLAHALTGGRRDFSSTAGVTAERYEVVADDEVAEDARTRLAAQGL